MFGYKEGAPDNSGAVGGEPSQGGSFSWLPLPSRLTFRAYNSPILKTESLRIFKSEEKLDIGDLCPFPLSFAE